MLHGTHFFFTFATKYVVMKRVFILLIALIVCVSQVFAQLVILNEQNEDITNTTINIQAGVETNYYFIVKNTGSTTIENLKSYLRIDGENVVSGEEAIAQMCSEPGGQCGVGTASPKFSLAPNAEQKIHLSIKSLSGTDFVVTTYPNGGEPVANFNIHAGTTGINASSVNSFNVYPSPADDNFFVENNCGKNSYVEIYNVLGQMVKRVSTDNTNRVSVNCSTWKNGYYVCRAIKDGKIEKTIKIVIAH